MVTLAKGARRVTPSRLEAQLPVHQVLPYPAHRASALLVSQQFILFLRVRIAFDSIVWHPLLFRYWIFLGDAHDSIPIPPQAFMPASGLPHGARYIIIAATTGMIWTCLAWLIRLFIRLRLHGPFWWDDIFCTIATVLAIVQSIITMCEVHFGLGHHGTELPTSVLEHQQTLDWISNQFYILSLTFSMLSACFLIARITQRTTQVRCAYVVGTLDGI